MCENWIVFCQKDNSKFKYAQASCSAAVSRLIKNAEKWKFRKLFGRFRQLKLKCAQILYSKIGFHVRDNFLQQTGTFEKFRKKYRVIYYIQIVPLKFLKNLTKFGIKKLGHMSFFKFFCRDNDENPELSKQKPSKSSAYFMQTELALSNPLQASRI